jgi:hypothetical protein
MAYPNLLYRGQYTLKRVLTMPAAVALTSSDIDKLVTVDATGEVILAPADAKFFGVLRTINTKDNICTVDFSGVHEFEASAAIDAGADVIPAGELTVKAGSGAGISKAVALTQAAAAGDRVQIFFLN